MGVKLKEKTIVLLDAHAIIHRAYHALPEFLSSKGEPTGALYGLSNMLMKIITDLKPDFIFACYDLPQKTFRHEAYENYKLGRAKADEALISQLKDSRKIFEAFNILIYDSPGFEADDVIGTIVEKIEKSDSKKEFKIIIASGDMDTMQLINGQKVQVYTLKKGINDTILYDEKAVLNRFNFKPELLPDFKGLRGDPSDNIIGIKGIGEKTATQLIVNFKTIENIYQKLNTLKGEIKFKEVGFSDRIINLLKENEEEAIFSKTLATIRRDAPIDFKIPEKTFWQNADIQKIENIFMLFEFKSLFNRIKSFFDKAGAENNTIPIFPENIQKIDKQKFIEASIIFWLLDSEKTNPTLEDILFFTKEKDLNKAYDFLLKKLKEEKLDLVYQEIEKPIIAIVKKMEEVGILIDLKYLKKLSQEYHLKLDLITQKIYQLAGTEFNINSPKQLGEILFTKMGIKNSKKKTASGAISTKISVLEELENEHLIIKEIIAHRELQKLLSTYIDVIPKMVALDGRLHARFLQNGTTTGRFASQDPNLQNLPIKTELGKRIRGAFIASPGYKLVAFDYSQIELRIAAILSKDPKMTKIFEDKKDIHAGVASFVFNISIDKVEAEMRRRAKIINFGIIYGMGVSALRKNLGGTREEAQDFYNNYFDQFSGVYNYLQEVKNFAVKNTFTQTLFGRKRKFANINSRIPFLKSMAERTATNAPIQGTAADIIKLAIRFSEEDLMKAGLLNEAHLILQVHDELVFEIKEEIMPQAIEIIKKAMENVLANSYLGYQTTIPLEVNYGIGNNLVEVK